MELIKDVIKIDNRIDFGKYQTYIESEAVVPDKKSDVYEVIKTEGYAALKKIEMSDGKILCKGSFNYNVMYMTDDKSTVSNVCGKIEINEIIEKDSVSPDMENMLFTEIEHIDCTIMNERKIKVSALINIKGSLFEKNRMDIVKDVSQVDEIQKHRKEICYQDIIGIEKSESIIRDTVPVTKEDVQGVISVNPVVKIKDTKVTDNKVIVGGTVEVNPLACTFDGDIIQLDKVGVDFTQFIEVPGVSDGMKEEVNICISELNYTFKQNEEGNSGLLELDCTVLSKVKVTDEVVREVLQDAYSPQKMIKFDYKQTDINKLIASDVDSFILREGIRNDNDDIQIQDIVSVCSNISIENAYMEDGKSTIQGIIKIDILYVPVEGLKLIYKISEEIPFEHELEVDVLDDNYRVFNTVCIEKLDVDLNKDEIDLSIKVKRCTEVVLRKSESFIVKGEDMGEYDLSKAPSLVVYICKENDTLWNVAKKYNTTEEEIMSINDIKMEDELKPGKCLILEKKMLVCE